MKAVPDTLSSAAPSVKVQIRNVSSSQYWYGSYYSFQKWTSKGWEPVVFTNINIGWELSLHWIEPGQVQALECYLYRKGYEYKPGKYRILKSFKLDKYSEKDDIEVVAEFYIQ